MEQQIKKLRADATPFIPKCQSIKLNPNALEFKPSTYMSYYSGAIPLQHNNIKHHDIPLLQNTHLDTTVNIITSNKCSTSLTKEEFKVSLKSEEIKQTALTEIIPNKTQPIDSDKQEIKKVCYLPNPTTKESTLKFIKYEAEYIRTFREKCHARPFHMKEVNLPLLKWKPPINEDAQVIIIKEVRNILNKISKSNYKEMARKIVNDFQYTPTVLEELSKILFNKAVKEACYVEYYMELSDMLFKKFKSAEMNFRKMFISRCQSLFEGKVSEDMEKYVDVDDEEKRIKHKLRLMGNMKLIGELFIRAALNEEIVFLCINRLTVQVTEENVENLCYLYRKIGKSIYQFTAYASGQTSLKKKPRMKIKKLTKELFDDYIDKLADIKATNLISSRIKFMIQDILELRETEWAQVFDEFIVKENSSNKIVFHVKHYPIPVQTKEPLNIQADPKIEARELRKSSLNETSILGIDLEQFGKVKLDEKARLKANNYVDEYLTSLRYEEAKAAYGELIKHNNTTHIWIGFIIIYANSKKLKETTAIFDLLLKLVKDNTLLQIDLLKG